VELLILGGTFDPIHLGHLHLADLASTYFGGVPVVFVPANRPAHKDSNGISPAEHRVAMVKAAVKGTPWIVDTSEIDRGGTSYTIDTIREITSKFNLKEKPGIIMGDDLAEGFSRWRNPQEILAEAQVVVASRLENVAPYDFPHVPLENAILPISSTLIRENASQGGAFRYLVPPGVYDYIIKKGLYEKKH